MELPKLASKVIELLRSCHKTCGFAESCTGGLIGKTITDVSGASEVFYGSIVSYDNSVKNKLLGVSKASLDTVGAVSADVAIQMALGAMEALDVDVTVAVTGIAGPGGGTEEKPVGLVYMAICYGDKLIQCEKCHFDGTREEIRQKTTAHAFEMILEKSKEIEQWER